MSRKLLFIGIFFCGLLTALSGQPHELLRTTDQVEIPFTFHHNFIIVNIRFENKLPLKFLFDTGAEHTLLFKKSYADLAGIKYSKRISLVGSDLSTELYAYIARSVGIQLFPLANIKQDILVLDQNFTYLDELVGMNIDGLLGASFFKNFAVKIDYNNAIITLTSPKAFKPPKKKYTSIPLEILYSKPYVNALAVFQSSDTAKTKLLLDTGAGLSLLLHSNTHESIKLPEQTITGSLGSGLGGELTGYVGKIDQLTTLDVTFSDVVTSFQDLDKSILSSHKLVRNGIIGNQILSRFTIVIDYPRSTLYIRPRKHINKKFEFDRSGLTIFAVGDELDELIVQEVLEGSPAWNAGIRKGDYIRYLQRLPAKFYSLAGAMKKMRKKAGKNIRIRIERDGETKVCKFKLADLI